MGEKTIRNPKVVFNSLLAIASIILSVFVNWLFIIPAVVLMILNQKILLSKKK